MSRIVVRVDSGATIGGGHVSRCLALAETLRQRGAEVLFISRDHPGNAAERIEAAGFELRRLAAPVSAADAGRYLSWLGTDVPVDADESARIVDGFKADWVVVDHYGVDRQWEQTVRKACGGLLAIDDLRGRAHACDVVVNQNLQFGESLSRVLLSEDVDSALDLFGPRYALLSTEYSFARRMVARAATDVVRVLVSFGSCLPQGLVESVLRALSCNGLDDLYVDVVVSSGTEVNGELRKIARRRDRCTVHSALPSLAGLKLRSDIALGAGGVSMLERASLGLPSVVAITAENQRQPAEAMAARGAILLLGLSESVVDQDWASAVLSLRDDASRRLKMAQAAAALVDCWGTHRVAAAMLGIGTNSIILREATAGDETLLLDWANDPVVRCNSFNEEAISPEVHRNWFGRQLADPRSAIFVAIGPAGLPVGQIRVETDESESFARIHISVDPALRGKGVGRLMLAAIVERARRRPTLARLFAEVRNGNHASRRIFLASGFREIPTANLDRITFELNL